MFTSSHKHMLPKSSRMQTGPTSKPQGIMTKVGRSSNHAAQNTKKKKSFSIWAASFSQLPFASCIVSNVDTINDKSHKSSYHITTL